MTDILERIRHAYRPVDVDESRLDEWFDDLRLERPAITPSRRRRAGARAPKLMVAVVVLVASVSSIALARMDVVQRTFGLNTSRPAAEMRVFDEPVTISADDLESGDMLEMGFGARSGIDGEPDLSRIHEVADFTDGDFRIRMVTFPTSTEKACMYVEQYRRGRLTSGGGGCSGGFRYNGAVTVATSYNIRDGLTVYGLSTDRVTRVRIRLPRGQIRAAEMGTNGWLWHGSPRHRQARGLLVDLDDGTTLDVAMNGCLRSQLVPPPTSRLGCGYGMNNGPHD